MSATAPQRVPAEHTESFADDIVGMGSFFIDPNGAARRVFHKWFWVGPIVVGSIVTAITIYMRMPLVHHVLEVGPTAANAPPDQYQKAIEMSMLVQTISMYLSPLLVLGIVFIQSAIVLGMSSVLNVKSGMRSLFNLLAGCGLIGALEALASLLIVKAKGEPSTMAELQPPLGLDIFLSEGANKFVLATLGYFSVFQIWWIVMVALVFSAAFKVKKSTAFAAIAPLVVLGLLLRLVGAAFRRA
jgi:hypothetical protein